MKNFGTLTFILIFPAFILGAQIICQDLLKGGYVSMTADGKTIAVAQQQLQSLYNLIIFKKTDIGYQSIKVRNAKLHIPSSNYTDLIKFANQAKFKPQFSVDGSQLYFIDFQNGFPTRGDLSQISQSSPYLINIKIYDLYCTKSAYFCFYSLQDDYMAIYAQNNSQVTLLSKGVQVKRVFLNSSTCLSYNCSENFNIINFEWDSLLNRITILRGDDLPIYWIYVYYSAQTGLFNSYQASSMFSWQYLNLRKFQRAYLYFHNYFYDDQGFVSKQLFHF